MKLLYVFLTFLMASCSAALPDSSTDSWWGDDEVTGTSGLVASELTVIQDMGEVQYEAMFRPADSLIYQFRSRISEDEKKGLREELERNYRFHFRISQNESREDLLKTLSATPEDYDSLLKYCSFSIQGDFQLRMEDGSVIPCGQSIYERSYGMQPGLQLILDFPRSNRTPHNVRLEYNDHLLGRGPIKFYFENLPV